MTDAPLLAVEGLTATFETADGTLVAVDDVDFTIEAGETLCLVGESGSGKTVASESLTRLVESPSASVTGSIRFRGREVTAMSDAELRDLRGGEIAHVFQNPQDTLNHCYTVGWQIVEAIQTHEPGVSDTRARERAVALLDDVGIANAATRFEDYPHELSGGQKQRVMLAMALATNPALLVADEPTTALDVTVQARILDLLDDLQDEYGMALLFVTHDLGVVAEIADRVVVMYAGKVMERGRVLDIFESPAHPYTQALMACVPGQEGRSEPIGGSLPDPTDPPDGCRFAPRCPHAVAACHEGTHPEEHAVADGHTAACLFYGPGYDASVVRQTGGGDDATSGRDAADD